MTYLKKRFKEQNGKCFYCGFDAWLPTWGLINAANRLGLPISGPNWRKSIQRRMATKEHLQRRADGGPDAFHNYAMAHQWCNKVRGERTVEEHKAAILEMINTGRCKAAPNWKPETAIEKRRRFAKSASDIQARKDTTTCVGAHSCGNPPQIERQSERSFT